MSALDVVVSIINYNSAQHTKTCVRSIIEKTDPLINYQIIVIDNNSAIDDFNLLSELSNNPKVRLIRNRINKGFSGGHMSTIDHLEEVPEFILFQNNDSYFLNDYLKSCLSFARSIKSFGVIGGSTIDQNGNYVISHHYHPSVINKLFGRKLAAFLGREEYLHKKEVPQKPTTVDVINGSSMFVSTDNFFKIGGMDTTFFLYCEEEDLALRMNKVGLNNYLLPDAKYVHLEGMSTPKSFDIIREFYISFLFYYRKNYGIISTYIIQVMLLFKNARKIFKDKNYIKLILFILRGAPLNHSIKYKQEIETN